MFFQVPIQTSSPDTERQAEEVQQLRETVESLTAQCAQLDAANRTWQQYQQAQVDNLRNTLGDYVPIDGNTSFDAFAQLIVDQIVKEREESDNSFQAIEKTNEELRSGNFPFTLSNLTHVIFSVEYTNNLDVIKQSYMNTINELNQELLAIKEAYNQLDTEKQALITELEERPADQLQESVAVLTAQCAQLDAANRAWQQYQETQANSFRSKLQDFLPIDENVSFDEIPQQLIDQIVKEREDVNERFQAIEKANEELRSGSLILIFLIILPLRFSV
jgi:t-SNARE complex subunit (syntaxin)